MGKIHQTCRLFLAVLASATLSFAQDAEKPLPPYYLLPEPAFMKPPIGVLITGAKSTLIVPAIRENDTFRYLTREDMRTINIPRAEFDKIAQRNANAALKAIKPRMLKGNKNVIECAILETNNQMASTAILSPDFAAHFEPIFGPEMIILVPSRDLVYVFPKLAGFFEAMNYIIIDQYNNALHPVSFEIFEMKGGKLETIGSYNR